MAFSLNHIDHEPTKQNKKDFVIRVFNKMHTNEML